MRKKNLVTLVIVATLLTWTSAAYAKEGYGRGKHGAVFAMTNDADDNQIVIFERDHDGLLTLSGTVSTGGHGSGGGLDPLASQGSVVLTENNRWLLAVNAGSNDISVFLVKRDALKLVDQVDSGGEFPVSLTVFHNLVYVLNAGGSANITGFYLSNRGELIHRDHSTRDLETGGFAQVGFDPWGDNLVITDRDENEILVFKLGWHGLPAMEPVTSPSNGIAPFGFIFTEKGKLLVSEAGSGAVSLYAINADGSLRVISLSVENGQIATCWIAGNDDGYIFTANTGSQTLSAYSLIDGKGKWHNRDRWDEAKRWKGKHRKYDSELELLDATAGFGNRPIDMDISFNGRFLYALDPAEGTIDMFKIESDGSLTNLGIVSGGFSIFAQGIAVN